MDKNNIFVLLLLILSLVVTATLVLKLTKNSENQNQEFKERTLILIDETKEGDTTNKVQYTICQWTEKKIEIEICPLENDVKKECSYKYPGTYNCEFENEDFINLLDELKIQPGDTTTMNMEDLEDEIKDKYGYLLGEGEGEGDGNGIGEVPEIDKP